MWIVPPKDPGAVGTSYTATTIAQEITRNAIEQPELPFHQQEIVTALVEMLSKEALLRASNYALIEVAFRYGYLYRLFLERHDVVYPKSPPDATASDQES